MHKNRKWIFILLLPALLFYAVVFLGAFIVLITTAFTSWTAAGTLSFTGLDNFTALLSDQNFIAATKNTLVWILLQSTIHVAIGLIFALILSQKLFYWKFARISFMLPNIISAAAIGIMFKMILNPEWGVINIILKNLHLSNLALNWFYDKSTAFGVVTLTWLPYAGIISILILAELASIDHAYYESAKIDGASELQISLYIKLPLLRNIIGVSTIIAATSMLQKFDILMITTKGGPGTLTTNLPIYIYQTAFSDNNFGSANAQGIVLIVLGLAVVWLINKIYRLERSN